MLLFCDNVLQVMGVLESFALPVIAYIVRTNSVI